MVKFLFLTMEIHELISAQMHIFMPSEHSHEQSNKVKILMVPGFSGERHSMFTGLSIGVFRYMMILYFSFLCHQPSISSVGYKKLSEEHQYY